MADLVPAGGEVLPGDRQAAVAEWVRRWLDSLRAKSTRGEYHREVRMFVAWLGGDMLSLAGVTRATADAYRQHLVDRELSPHTINRKLSALSSLYGYAVAEDWLTRSPFARVRRMEVDSTEGSTPGLTVAQLAAVLRVARRRGPRTFALVLVFATTAVRVSEALSMRLEGVVWEEDPDTGLTYCYRWVTRKRGRRERVVVPDLANVAIDRLAEHEGRTEGPVFATRSGRPVERTDAYDTIRRVGELANADLPDGDRIDHLYPHMLRVFAATAALRQHPLHIVQDMLGHRDPRTTQRYNRGRLKGPDSPSHALADKVADLLRDPGHVSAPRPGG